jgi:hypothetical protein
MTVEQIIIKNIRGISYLEINDKIIKNKPNILVAPNGFGKSSIANAFKYASNQTYLKVPDDERFEHKKSNKAKLEIKVSENNIQETMPVKEEAHSNNIRKNFDIHVISDLRKIKATNRNFGTFSRADAKEIIEPIVLTKKINNSPTPYKITDLKHEFGNNNSILKNLSNSLFKNKDFLMRTNEFMALVTKIKNTKVPNGINSIKDTCSNSSGIVDEELIISQINQLCDKKEILLKAINIIVETTNYSKYDAFLCFWQIITVSHESLNELKAHLEYLNYQSLKKAITNLLVEINSSWKTTVVRETKGDLIIDMPEPSTISNGQRDVLCLVAMLFKARFFLKKSKAILIIDEVFDYLDDANIVVGQYFISQIINEFKKQGRTIYPIILTHLNPSFFKNYVFQNQKVIYLRGQDINDSIDAMKKLISLRDDDGCNNALKDNISKYLVHYHIANYDFKHELESFNNVRSSWGKAGKFQEYIKSEYQNYINDKNYDPLAICAITRRSVEELAYKKISTMTNANEFFEKHTTVKKLKWIISNNAEVPESHFLLRIIFDDGLHWRPSKDNTIPIVAKLSNPVIKKMIKEVVEATS